MSGASKNIYILSWSWRAPRGGLGGPEGGLVVGLGWILARLFFERGGCARKKGLWLEPSQKKTCICPSTTKNIPLGRGSGAPVLGRFWEGLGRFGRAWEGLEGFGTFLGRLGKVWEGLGRVWNGLRRFVKFRKIFGRIEKV